MSRPVALLDKVRIVVVGYIRSITNHRNDNCRICMTSHWRRAWGTLHYWSLPKMVLKIKISKMLHSIWIAESRHQSPNKRCRAFVLLFRWLEQNYLVKSKDLSKYHAKLIWHLQSRQQWLIWLWSGEYYSTNAHYREAARAPSGIKKATSMGTACLYYECSQVWACFEYWGLGLPRPKTSGAIILKQVLL